LRPHDGFLFLMEPLNFLLYLDQLLQLCSGFIFVVFFITLLHVDLIELDVALDGMC
jgi:hypothetical protein